jgi:hypothetical protein
MEVVMSDKLNLQEADRQVFTAGFEDGLVDIFLASFVLMFAIGPFLSVYLGDFWSSAIFLPLWFMVFLVLRWIRIHVIRPRSGVVSYGPVRKKKMTVYVWIMLALNILFLIAGFVFSFMPTSPGWTRIIPFIAMLLICSTLAGYFLNITRFYVYGLMMAGGFFVGEWLYQTFGVAHHGYPIVFGISTGIIFLIGLIKLITFIHDNPVPVDELMLQEGENG